MKVVPPPVRHAVGVNLAPILQTHRANPVAESCFDAADVLSIGTGQFRPHKT
jgi:hypothetical protein